MTTTRHGTTSKACFGPMVLIARAAAVLAAQLMASSKKGMSALQLQRMLGTTYETAWFLFHRLRECAIDPKRGPIGGENKVVEADD